MKIKNTVEREDGTVVFQGILEGPELALVIQTGINTLVKQGAVPFASLKTINPVDLHVGESDSVN